MTLLQMSLSGGVMILAAALVRALALHRLPKRFFVLLWTLALVRLLVPFSLPAACSVYSLFSRPAPVAVYASGPVHLSPAPPSAWTGGVGAGEAFIFEGAAVSAADPWGMIWLTGLALCAGYFGVAYFKCRREFREALPVHNAYVEQWIGAHRLWRPIAVRQSDKITAPLTYGILHPVILLPKSTDWMDTETLDYVLTHEWVHIRRFDGLLKLALVAALCVHWFNPLVWAMVLFANRDIELACDEAVLKRLGREAKAGYALALLRMEERKSGLSMAGSHFSKNSLEERIKAMLKRKKSSLAALLAAILLIGGTGAVFATSTKAENQEMDLRPGAAAETTYSTENKDSLLSYTDGDGTTYYSWDEGKTWTPMTDQEFAVAYPDPDVEWWTAEEYAAWLENEKESLQDMVGSRGWTAATGWFTWTQEMVAETIAQYEEVLAMIKNGYLVSKSVDGDENTMLVMNPLDRVVGSGDWESTMEEKEYSDVDNFDYTSLFEDYKRCGLTFQNNDGILYWKGQQVRIFADGAEYGDGYASWYEHYDPEGTIDVRTVRERVDNGDGSYSLMGPLVRLEEFEPDQMFLDALEGQRYVGAESQYEAERSAKELERYKPFGLAYSFDPNQETGQLSMTWNGQPVRSLFDPERQLWVCNSLGTKGLNLESVYENGRLTGLREGDEKSYVEAAMAIDSETAAAESNGDDGSGQTIAERMEPFAAYGVSYQEIGGKKVIRYNGKPVSSFSDVRPDGSVFSVESTDGGEIVLVTDYDGDGKLKGVKAMMSYRF